MKSDAPDPSPMRFGLLLPLFATPFAAVRDAARRAEAAGLDDVWVSDHLLGVPDRSTSVLEGWTTLVALAASTERIGLGSLVLAATFRPPRLLAKSVQTLAEISGPRLTLGLGAGWVEEEHHAFDLPYASFGERLGLVEQTIDAVRELAPGVPVLVGGASNKLLDLAARKADLWNAPADRLDDLPALAASVSTRAAAAGRQVELVARTGLVLAATDEEAHERVARRASPWARMGLGPLGLVGDADGIARRVEALQALGVSRIVMGVSSRDLADGTLERFGATVLPRCR